MNVALKKFENSWLANSACEVAYSAPWDDVPKAERKKRNELQCRKINDLLGYLIRQRRTTLHMSLRDLSKKSGISVRHLIKLSKGGTVKCSLISFVRLAIALKCEPHEALRDILMPQLSETDCPQVVRLVD